MLVNLTDVLTSEGKVEQKSIPIEMDSFSCRLGEFEIVSKTPVELILTNLGIGKASIVGKTDVSLRMSCDRCVKPVDVLLELEFEHDVMAPDENRQNSEEDDLVFIDGYQLDVEILISNEILVNWPMKVLCKPDCKGICKQCGKDLNMGECACDTFVPDPRMAAIKDIFYGNKEV